MVSRHFSSHPFRGGSTTITSAYTWFFSYCSGSTSFVLKEAGLLTSTRHSKLFLNYGQKGAGDWISVYAKNGHVFMVICGLRFDTTGSGRRGEGPRWRVDGRNARNFLVRHPTGL